MSASIGSLDGRITQYYFLASSVVFYYDFILTMPQEIKYIWSSKFKVVNVLVIALRYTTAFGYIPNLMISFSTVSFIARNWLRGSRLFFDFHLTFRFSDRIDKLPGIIGIICQSLTLMFLIIRIYAIFDKRRWILYTTVPFGLLTIVLSSLAVGASVKVISIVLDVDGGIDAPIHSVSASCFASPSFARGNPLSLFRLSYVATLLFDTLIFILALIRMGRMHRAKLLCNSRSSVVSILLRDGSMLFAILTISNLFNFVTCMLIFRGVKPSTDGNINITAGAEATAFLKFLFVLSSGTNSEMTHALSVVLVSRMIFNLREAGTEIYEGTEEWRSRIERDAGVMQFRVPTVIYE